jgi:hypothetical protein
MGSLHETYRITLGPGIPSRVGLVSQSPSDVYPPSRCHRTARDPTRRQRRSTAARHTCARIRCTWSRRNSSESSAILSGSGSSSSSPAGNEPSEISKPNCTSTPVERLSIWQPCANRVSYRAEEPAAASTTPSETHAYRSCSRSQSRSSHPRSLTHTPSSANSPRSRPHPMGADRPRLPAPGARQAPSRAMSTPSKPQDPIRSVSSCQHRSPKRGSTARASRHFPD